MKKRKIIGLLIFLLGFIGLVAFLILSKSISTDAWLYAVWVSICTDMIWVGSFLNES